MDRRSLLTGRRASPTAPVAQPPAPLVRTPPPPTAPPYAGGLAPFVPTPDAPWEVSRAKHLVRRTGFGTPRASVDAALATTPALAATILVDAALAAGTPPRPDWADLVRPPTGAPQAQVDAYNAANTAGIAASQVSVFDEALGVRHAGSPLRERLALLWHGHVTTNLGEYGSRAARLYRYWDALRRHGPGDFQAMIREIGTTQAMLVYLNGAQSRVGNPNENYARELLELFTTGLRRPNGQPAYSQTDIEELARALTGWTAPSTENEGVFVPSRHDAGDKTLFGVTAPLDYATAHDVLFAERADAIALNVCRRLYRGFVHDTPNEQVVAEMTALFLPAFNVEPVLRALLQSQHFFSPGAMGSQIKAPLDAVVGLGVDSGYSNLPGLYNFMRTRARDLGFDLFRPPDVSGWDGGRTWLDTSRLPLRWLWADSFWSRRNETRELALALPINAFNPYDLVDGLADHLVAVPVSAAARAECVAILLGGIPDYDWNPNASSAPARIRAAVQFLTRLPEFQLA